VCYYLILKDFAGPLATLFAACAATYFAWQQSKTGQRQAETAAQLAETAKRQGERQARTAEQQAKTALDQLRFNLFEKRYATYRAVEQFLKTLISDAHKPEFRAFDVAPY
jgi:ABC-type transporter MlaC component